MSPPSRQHSISYMGDGFHGLKDPTNSIKVLKEHIEHRQIKHTIIKHEQKTQNFVKLMVYKSGVKGRRRDRQ